MPRFARLFHFTRNKRFERALPLDSKTIMIYYVNGDFIEKTATNVIVDCAGIGYDVQISLTTYADIEALNKGRLYTYHLIREDAEILFGFSTKREKSFI